MKNFFAEHKKLQPQHDQIPDKVSGKAPSAPGFWLV